MFGCRLVSDNSDDDSLSNGVLVLLIWNNGIDGADDLVEVDELVRKHLPLLNCKLGRVVVDDGVEGSLAHLQTYAMARW